MNTESKSRYKTTNWSEYNQALRQRGAFTIWFDPQMQWSATPSGKKGRQPTYTDIAIQFALTIRNCSNWLYAKHKVSFKAFFKWLTSTGMFQTSQH